MTDSAALSTVSPIGDGSNPSGPDLPSPGDSSSLRQQGAGVRVIGDGETVVAVAYGPSVSVYNVFLPTRSVSQARIAAPYAIEDELAVDPTDVHAAVAFDDERHTWAVAVVDKETMTSWSNDLSKRGVIPSTLVPECAAIAPQPGQVIIIDRGAYVVAAMDKGPGFASEPDLFPLILGAVLAGSDVEDIEIHSNLPHSLLPVQGIDLSSVKTHPSMSDDAYDALLIDGARRTALNLFQGSFAPKQTWLDIQKSWGGLAAVAGLCLVSYFALLVAEAVQFNRQTAQAEAEVESVFRQALPDVRRMVNPRVQLQARLNSGAGVTQDYFLSFTSVLTDALFAVPGSNLESLQYDANRGELSANISLSDYADMERIRDLVVQRGLMLTEGSSRQQNGRVISDVKVTGR